MMTKRFLQSLHFTAQHGLVWYNRTPLVDICVDKLENGTAEIVNCPDEKNSYTEYNKCRVYFEDYDLIGIEFV